MDRKDRIDRTTRSLGINLKQNLRPMKPHDGMMKKKGIAEAGLHFVVVKRLNLSLNFPKYRLPSSSVAVETVAFGSTLLGENEFDCVTPCARPNIQ